MLTAIGSFVVRRKYIVLATWFIVILGALPFAPRAQEFLKPGGFSNESFPSVQARKVLQERLELTTLTVDFVFSLATGKTRSCEGDFIAPNDEPSKDLGNVDLGSASFRVLRVALIENEYPTG